MKADKKALLEFAQNNGWKYPRLYVWSAFSLFGGLTGGICVSAYDFLYNLTIGDSLLSVSDYLSLAILGGIFGFPPATLTGLYASFRKIILTNFIDYLHLYLVGTLISAIDFNLWGNFSDGWQRYLELWQIGSIGGISAMICGKLFLPKLPKNF